MTAEQRRRLAATVVEEATQLARLTDNTLQLARLGGTGLALHFDWESAEELVGTAVRRVRQRDPARRVDTHLEDRLPLLRCDAPLLVQLLDNLIDNAFKYGGGGTVEVVARRADGTVVIAVQDRGPGVPAEWRERIFEAFQRAPQPAAAAEAARRGAGVGLAVCRAVARAHGGELVLRDRPGGGSSFELSLPVEPMPPPPREPGARAP
jgi:two-component system sensor histidine kinase KdpD